MKRITQTNEIQSGDNSGIVVSGDEKIAYSSEFGLDDFELDEVITKRAAQDLVNQNQPSSVLAPWTPDPTQTDEYRTHPINGIEYLFKSLVDENISEPSLTGGGESVWEKTNELGYPNQYNGFTTYPEGRIVWDYEEIGADPPVYIGYRSLQDGNLNHTPSVAGDTEWWEKLGIYASPFTFVPDTTYPLGAVVVDDTDSDRIYISKIADNDKPLNYVVPGSNTWQVIGAPSGGSTNIGAFDFPATGDFGPQEITLTDEQRELVGNYPDVKVFAVDGLTETQMPDPNPVFVRDSEGLLLTITIDASEGQIIRVTGANAGVTPGGGGTGETPPLIDVLQVGRDTDNEGIWFGGESGFNAAVRYDGDSQYRGIWHPNNETFEDANIVFEADHTLFPLPARSLLAPVIDQDLANKAYVDSVAGGGGGGGVLFVDKETPSGDIDGTNTDYTLAYVPISGSEHVYLNGVLQDSGAENDYTISGAVISMADPLETSEDYTDKLRVSYRR